MAEGAMTQAKEGLHEPFKAPIAWIVGGVLFLFLVLIIEAFKPGAITGPIKSLLAMVGIGTGA